MNPPEQVLLGWVSFCVMKCPSLLPWILQDQVSEGGMGFEYVRDLHSDLSSAMANHSLKLTGSPSHFRALFNAICQFLELYNTNPNDAEANAACRGVQL